MIASLMTGAVISVNLQELGLPYHILFVIASLATVLFVGASGLFLAVAQIPIIFAVITPIAQWSISDALAGEAQKGQISKTSIITSAYALVSNFPVLLLVTILTISLGLGRYYLAMRTYRMASTVAERQTEAAKSAAVTTATAVKARTRRSMDARPGQLTVDDLIKQRRERTEAANKARREQQAKNGALRSPEAEKTAATNRAERVRRRASHAAPETPSTTRPTTSKLRVRDSDTEPRRFNVRDASESQVTRFRVRKADED
ncbi:MAG: hypothetical protein Q3972_01770 [Corynebacterium sp.]|nr:hypothetical protein [Corynebacterium sp.]